MPDFRVKRISDEPITKFAASFLERCTLLDTGRVARKFRR